MSRKTSRILALLMCLCLTAGALSGCGGGGISGTAQAPSGEAAVADGEDAGEGAGTAAAPGGDGVQVRIMTRWSDESPYSVYYRQKVEEFNGAGHGVTIVDESLSDEAAFLDKLRSSIATGNQPEIFIEYGGARIQDYVEAGILLDLEPYLEADPQWRDSFLDDLFDKWYYDDYPGVYGVPCQFYAVLLYYNRDILAENGYEAPPATLDEWMEMCQTMLENGQQPMSLGEKDNWRGGHFFNNLVMKSYGAAGVDALGDRSLAYDSNEIIGLFSTIKEFNDRGFFGPNAVGVDGDTEDTDFLTNKVGLRFQGTWFIPRLVSEYEGELDNIGIAPFPYINEAYKGSYQGGTAEAFSISNREATNEAAVQVVKYLTNQDFYRGAEAYCQGGVYVSKFDSDPSVEIDPLTLAAKDLMARASEFRDDIQTYDPESHMLDTVRAAIQGLFIGSSPEQCAEEIVNQQQIK